MKILLTISDAFSFGSIPPAQRICQMLASLPCTAENVSGEPLDHALAQVQTLAEALQCISEQMPEEAPLLEMYHDTESAESNGVNYVSYEHAKLARIALKKAGIVPRGGNPTPLCGCGNCDWTGPADEIDVGLDDCKDLAERLDPGGVVPAGECPECQAFAYYQVDKDALVEVQS